MLVEILTNDQSGIKDLFNALTKHCLLSHTMGTADVYTPQQLCAKLNISMATLKAWRKKGLIEYSKIGRKIYFLREDVITLIEGHAKKSREGIGKEVSKISNLSK